MKKKIAIGLLMISILSLAGCGKAATRNYGGTSTIDLPANKKLINITWKESNIWYLTRDMKEGDIAETYEFVEDSNYGAFEGTVIIKEIKTK